MTPKVIKYQPFQCSSQDFVEALKKCPGVTRYIDAIGPARDRHIVVVNVSQIRIHPEVGAVRKATPDIALLKDSVGRSGEPLQMILLFVMLDEAGTLTLLVADGGLRYQSIVANGISEITAVVIEPWKSASDAARGTMDLASARYALTQSDIMNVLAKRLMTVADVAKLTGMGKSTIERFETCSHYQWLVTGIEADFIGYSMAARLVLACNNNGPKLAALETSFTQVYTSAGESVKTWKLRLQNAKAQKKRFDDETRKRANFSFYGKQHNWDEWGELLELDQIEERDGKWQILFPEGSSSHTTLAVAFEENPKIQALKFPFRNLEGREYADLALDDLELIDEQWDHIGKYVRKALAVRKQLADVTDDRIKKSVYPEEQTKQ